MCGRCGSRCRSEMKSVVIATAAGRGAASSHEFGFFDHDLRGRHVGHERTRGARGNGCDLVDDVLALGHLAEYRVAPGHAIGLRSEIQALVVEEIDEISGTAGQGIVLVARNGDGVFEVGQTVVRFVRYALARTLL